MSARECPSQGAERIPSGDRVYWLDVARTVAILSITLNHAVNRTYSNYSDQMGEFLESSLISSLLKTVTTVFSHLGVPLFLMISGALLLSKRMETGEDVRRFYRHNLMGLFITSEIWYFIMYWFLVLADPGQETLRHSTALHLIGGLVKTMLFVDQVTFSSTWYIPMILCLYTVIPLLALVLKRVPLWTLLLPAAVVFATFLVHDLNGTLAVAGLENRFSLALKASNVFSFYLLYVLLGYWLKEGGLNRLPTFLVAVGTVLSFGGVCALQLYMYSRPMDYLLDYDFTGYIICAAFTFELIRRCAHRIGGLRRPVTYLSQISFGIYFVHILIMSLLFWYVKPFCRASLFMLFLEAVSFGGSVVLIALLSRIPLLKRYLFLIKDGKGR